MKSNNPILFSFKFSKPTSFHIWLRGFRRGILQPNLETKLVSLRKTIRSLHFWMHQLSDLIKSKKKNLFNSWSSYLSPLLSSTEVCPRIGWVGWLTFYHRPWAFPIRSYRRRRHHYYDVVTAPLHHQVETTSLQCAFLLPDTICRSLHPPPDGGGL